jgi:phosphoglycerol transferase MdoB-like AlkP superfamily enzyme
VSLSTEGIRLASPTYSAWFGSFRTATVRERYGLGLLLALHGAAIVIMSQTEVGAIAKLAFLLVWAGLNFAAAALSRRPLAAAICALALLSALILLSQFKHEKLWLTVDFVDVMIVDQDTAAFLLQALPQLRWPVAVAAIGVVALLVAAWRVDPLRIRRRIALTGTACCMGTLVALAVSFPTDLVEDFSGQNYVSKFARTAVEAVDELIEQGYLEKSDTAPEHISTVPASCKPSRKLPHIILVHDESSFDITAVPGIRVPPNYSDFFRSQDGKSRKLIVEGAGGPSWFTEYNVLTGLSARSYGRFATSVTRIAAGHVRRGLPLALRRCGYKTYSLYPFYGAFLGSRVFQKTTGIGTYLDMRDLGTRDFEADSFYFERARQIIAQQATSGPLFLYVYTVANHFPWDTRLRPTLTPDWRDPGNGRQVDEYIRRQTMTAHDYRAFLKKLATDFPNESFLVVRYGDHLPSLALRLMDPSLDEAAIAQRLQVSDPRYLTTYYALDAVNFQPADLSSSLGTLDAPYLPLIIQEAAGVPLGPSFQEQKTILIRCRGFFIAAGMVAKPGSLTAC